MHQVRVTFGHELDPSDCQSQGLALSGHNEVDQPVLVPVLARLKCPKTKVLCSRRGMLRLGGLSRGRGSNSVGHDPLPSGSSKRSRRDAL